MTGFLDPRIEAAWNELTRAVERRLAMETERDRLRAEQRARDLDRLRLAGHFGADDPVLKESR